MRSTMGIQSETDPLPPPGPRPPMTILEGTQSLGVPDWNDPLSPAVTEWIETIATGLHHDLSSDVNPFPKVTEEQKDRSVILASRFLWTRMSRKPRADMVGGG